MQIDFVTKSDLDRIESKVDRLLSLLDTPKTVTVSDICRQLKMCSSSVRYDFPWLLPNFGVSQYPGIKKWDMEVWKNWNARPVEERKREYLARQIELVKRNYKRPSSSRKTDKP